MHAQLHNLSSSLNGIESHLRTLEESIQDIGSVSDKPYPVGKVVVFVDATWNLLSLAYSWL